ncbi:malate dehydrogenase-like [Zerene cesonia]|uniref:malate dehydrogenase-like n=1 Tax=Zerene cesonia TaxID=33412 RepID=UPI0018E4F20B|nr:malate dehydrogenase-like [Zerene cesonia]
MVLTKRLFKLIANRILSRNYQVTIVGGASDVGQTIGLLLRTHPNIRKLVVHDTLDKTSGVVLDLSHVPVHSALQGYTGEDTLDNALKNTDVVIAASASPMKHGITDKEKFNRNAEFIRRLSLKIAKLRPMPFVGITTEPLNTLVPMASELLRNHGDYNPKKLFGITAVDAMRAQALYASENNLNPEECIVPVIGGHSEKTLLPLISQSKPECEMDEKKVRDFVNKVRKVGEFSTNARKGWSPTLSIAYGAMLFTQGVLDALDGRLAKVNALVENNDFGTSFFSGLVNIDQNGFCEMKRYTNITQLECNLLEQSIIELRKDVTMGKKILELA